MLAGTVCAMAGVSLSVCHKLRYSIKMVKPIELVFGPEAFVD